MSTRQHWICHNMCSPSFSVEGEPANSNTASVYSAKNEGGSAYVLMSLWTPGFSADAKFSPDAARRFADSLRAAADAAEQADSLYPSTQGA